MKVLILGSSGIIGQALSENLYQSRHQIQLWDLELGVEYDLRNPNNNRHLLDAMKNADLVYFLAFDVGGSKYLSHQAQKIIPNNLAIMENTFACLAEAKKPFFFASSQMSNMLDNAYGRLKHEGEMKTKKLGGKILKFWNVYGFEKPGIRSHVITDFIQSALLKNEIHIKTNGLETRQFLHQNDCAEILRYLGEHYYDINEDVLDVTSLQWTSIREVAEIIATCLNDKNIKIDNCPDQKDELQTIKNEPTKSLFPYLKKIRPLENGIQQLISWNLQNQNMKDISFVITGRNDNYGGDYLFRLQTFIDSINFLSNKFCVKSEIVMTEWNSPKSESPLYQRLKLDDSVPIRFIQVPTEVHNQLVNPYDLPLFDYHGKNVGIRNSRGHYIVITSSDIVFSEQLFEFFSKKLMKKNIVYRAKRVDVQPDRENAIEAKDLESHYSNRVIKENPAGFPIHYIRHIGGYKFGVSKNLFTNACGDFIMMHRDNWELLRGCPEYTDMIMHIDSLLLVTACKIFPQYIMPDRMSIFHLDHQRRVTPEIDERDQRLFKARTQSFHTQNHPKWGFPDNAFKTIELNYE